MDFPVNYRLLDAVVEILILLSTVEVSEWFIKYLTSLKKKTP